MSSLLYRRGRLAYSGTWWVTGRWVLAIAGIVALIEVKPPKLNNEIRVDGTPAQEVIDALPDASGGQGILAFHAGDGERGLLPQASSSRRSS
jgi:RND superfamily putative drug exporter